MKYVCFATLLLLLAGCTEDPNDPAAAETAPGIPSANPLPGVFRVKLAETEPELDTRAFTRSGGSGNPQFDKAATRAGAVSIRRVFSDGDRFRERRRKAGLHRWYDVQFPEECSVGEAMQRFGMPEGVVWVEPVYRMVPASGTSVTAIDGTAENPLASSPFNDPLQGNQWHLFNDGSLPGTTPGVDLNIRPAWTSVTGGQEVIVAVADGGIDWTHPDLAANMWDDGEGHCGYNFNRNSYEIIPSDHGTHVAGIIGAVNNNGIGVCGIAGGDGTSGSGVKLMSCQVFDDTGYASIEELMTWSADHGAVICQNSWLYTGATELSQSGREAIDYFIEYAGCDGQGNQIGPMKGGVVIFAAGNDGIQTPQYPAAYPPVLAVASLGADLRKASSSNFGDWIDLAAPGGDLNGKDERYGIYSTIPGGHYGFASGTSMACPQVSGLAALAVAKYGGPGFTNEMLEELLIGSGRKQETDLCNPECAGLLGAGLVDAEYLFFHDSEPEAVREASPMSGSTRLTLQWSVPADYLGRAVPTFTVYVSEEPLTSSSVGAIPETAKRYTVENPGAEVGETLSYVADGLKPKTKYWVALVSVSRYGTPSSEAYVFTAETANNAPEVCTPLPDLFLASSDKQGVTIDLASFFSDPDAPDDQLHFFVSFPSPGIVDARSEGSVLRILPLAVGTTTLTVIAQDNYGAAVTAPMRVMVDGTGATVQLFPNPCAEQLNVRIPGAVGNFPLRIRDRSGREILTATVPIRENENGNTGWTDVSQLDPGVYICTVDYYGRAISTNLVKR